MNEIIQGDLWILTTVISYMYIGIYMYGTTMTLNIILIWHALSAQGC